MKWSQTAQHIIKTIILTKSNVTRKSQPCGYGFAGYFMLSSETTFSLCICDRPRTMCDDCESVICDVRVWLNDKKKSDVDDTETAWGEIPHTDCYLITKGICRVRPKIGFVNIYRN